MSQHHLRRPRRVLVAVARRTAARWPGRAAARPGRARTASRAARVLRRARVHEASSASSRGGLLATRLVMVAVLPHGAHPPRRLRDWRRPASRIIRRAVLMN